MDLSTTYLGLKLKHPLMPGASPLADDLGSVRRLEDAGASAIVLRSLFEEQITRERLADEMHVRAHEHAFAEALTYLPSPDEFVFGPDRYLEQVRRIKEMVGVPVIASLNGTTPLGWTSYAAEMQAAGADALELNFYHVATEERESGADVERRLLETVRLVKTSVSIPVAVKLSPFFSSLPNLAHRLDEVGADGLVLFNRFYQPDIEPDTLETVPRLALSTSSDLLLRLRWLAILSGRVRASLAATGGVHTGIDALKAIMAGADAVQIVAALLEHGPGYLAIVLSDLERWLDAHEYASLRQAQGSMNLMRSPDPQAFERGNYMRILQSWPASPLSS
ncbi:MAG: dihydroorotate dehydrogenase [Acidobacteria bacterium RIFCSPLOWO2_02_FULL_67_36]|nr:MAG: dihydroorotate dehydrogenase [Acidobacteria bacterium RIFCSPLOWO2_02_FULL_67_36]OFW20908.1 MAG: dihydroorotate dehydrogenase [Acidobacteria bacterium RIFCSPLOWO2_12_FULL_66_21]